MPSMLPASKNTNKPQKPKNFKKAIGQLLSFMKSYRAILVVALIFALGSAFLQIMFPYFVGEITGVIAAVLPDPVTGAPGVALDMNRIIFLAVLTGILTIAAVVLAYFKSYIMAGVTQKVVQKIRSRIIKKINALRLKYFDSSSLGDVLSRLTNDVDLIGQWLGHLILTLVTSALMLVGLLIMMFIINWVMAFAAVASTLVGALSMALIMKRSQKHLRAQQKNLGDLNAQIEENYTGHSVIKAYSAGSSIKKNFEEANGRLQKSTAKANFFSILMHPLMGFVGNLGFVTVSVVGAALIASGNLSGVEGFAVIASFLVFVRLFSQPLLQLSEAGQAIQTTAAASERVFEFLNEDEMESELHKPRRLTEVKGKVEFIDVTFGYDSSKPIIKNFNATIEAGSKVAIVGPTGAGKTTLVNLLMRFYELDGGRILIDGVDIKQMRRAEIAGIFGMVLQDTWLFEGTLQDNIAYNALRTVEPQKLKRRVVRAAKLANLDHFIRTLPQGYKTMMDDKASLSQGQKQLVTIARAFVANKPMFILDEATSLVDTRTEVLIQDAMQRLTEGRTTFMIAHRLSTIKNADVILVLKDGDILEQGNHEALLKKKGFYAELYNAQWLA